MTTHNNMIYKIACVGAESLNIIYEIDLVVFEITSQTNKLLFFIKSKQTNKLFFYKISTDNSIFFMHSGREISNFNFNSFSWVYIETFMF